jgi:hypothetical protein
MNGAMAGLTVRWSLLDAPDGVEEQLAVLSYQELVGAAEVRSVGVVSSDRMAVTA